MSTDPSKHPLYMTKIKCQLIVIPAQAGIKVCRGIVATSGIDSRLRGNDKLFLSCTEVSINQVYPNA